MLFDKNSPKRSCPERRVLNIGTGGWWGEELRAMP